MLNYAREEIGQHVTALSTAGSPTFKDSTKRQLTNTTRELLRLISGARSSDEKNPHS